MKFHLTDRNTRWLGAILSSLDPSEPGEATAARRGGRVVRRGLALLLSALMVMIPMGQSSAFAQAYPSPDASAAADQAAGLGGAPPDYGPPPDQAAPPDEAPPPDYGPPPDQAPPPDNAPPPGYNQQGPQALTQDQLNQLVAPIALYPDGLVAQVLAASTYPTQVVEANRWLKAQGNAPAQQIAEEANDQPWDPSVKALTAFPSVLDQMDHNLQWTTDLGNAYYNQPQDVMAAIQDMRHQAEEAGNLRSTPQLTVDNEDDTIAIAPANPAVVYVPVYDPWTVWGYNLAPFPGFWYYPPPGVYFGGLAIGFGVGIGIGFWGGWGWGWNHWRCGWHDRAVFFHNRTFITRSTTVFNRGFSRPGGPPRAFAGTRGSFALHNGFRGGGFNRGGISNRGAFNRGGAAGMNRGATGFNRGASGFNRGARGLNRGSAGTFNRGGTTSRGFTGGRTFGGTTNRGFTGGRNFGGTANRGSTGGRNFNGGARPSFGGGGHSFGAAGGARSFGAGGGGRSFGGGGSGRSFGGGGGGRSFGGGGGHGGGGGRSFGGGGGGRGGGGGHRGR